MTPCLIGCHTSTATPAQYSFLAPVESMHMYADPVHEAARLHHGHTQALVQRGHDTYLRRHGM